MGMRFFIVAVVLVVGARDAAATCMQVENGCSVCCSGPGECSTSCKNANWRSDATSRFEIGVSGVGVRLDGELDAGARVAVSYQRLFGFNERLLGNELGVELGCERVWSAEVETLVTMTPILRVATTHRVRTPSVFGIVLPEVGASLRADAPTQIFFRWSAFPIDIRIGSRLALAIEPIALAVANGGGGTRWWLSSSIGLRLVFEGGDD